MISPTTITAKSAVVCPLPNSTYVRVFIHGPLLENDTDLRSLFVTEQAMLDACSAALLGSPKWHKLVKDWMDDVGGYWTIDDLSDRETAWSCIQHIDTDIAFEHSWDNLEAFAEWIRDRGYGDEVIKAITEATQ